MSTARLDRPSDPVDANFMRGGRNLVALERAGKAEVRAANIIARKSAIEAVIARRLAIARLATSYWRADRPYENRQK